MRPHQNLDVWNRSIEFTVEIYEATKDFPSDERFGLTSQLRRASVSIAANIAEGAGRKSPKDFLRFLSMAQGSASETETELLIGYRLGYMSESVYEDPSRRLDDIGRMITGLGRHISKKLDA